MLLVSVPLRSLLQLFLHFSSLHKKKRNHFKRLLPSLAQKTSMSELLKSIRHTNFHTHVASEEEKEVRERGQKDEEEEEKEEEEERPAACWGKPSDSFRLWLRACQQANMSERGGNKIQQDRRGEDGIVCRRKGRFCQRVREEKGRKLMVPGVVPSHSFFPHPHSSSPTSSHFPSSFLPRCSQHKGILSV